MATENICLSPSVNPIAFTVLIPLTWNYSDTWLTHTEQMCKQKVTWTQLCWIINPTISAPTKSEPSPSTSTKTATKRTLPKYCLPAIVCLITFTSLPKQESHNHRNGRYCNQARGAWNWVSDRPSTSPTPYQTILSCRAGRHLSWGQRAFVKLESNVSILSDDE